MFVAVQNSSTTLCHNYTPLPVRTGMERVIAGRCGPMFASVAKDDCVVTKLSKEAITVKYKDGKEESFQLGRRFGVAAGKEYPHEIVTDWKIGDKLKFGMTVVYNKHYFEPDLFNKGFTNFKMAVNARIALVEGSDGYEDSSAMSSDMSKRLGTSVGHIRDILLSRDQGVSNFVNIGDTVDPDTILCTIHNEQSESNLFDEETLKSLSILGALNPKAKYKGVVEKIEVFYVPEVDTMSDSLQEIVSDADRRLYKLQSALGQPKINGHVPAGYRVKGSVLSADNVIIRVYITEDLGMGVGDKLVVANQLKSTLGRIWTEPTVSEDGKPVDVMFGYQSVDNRIVGSPELIGTTATILIELGKRAFKAYNS